MLRRHLEMCKAFRDVLALLREELSLFAHERTLKLKQVVRLSHMHRLLDKVQRFPDQ